VVTERSTETFGERSVEPRGRWACRSDGALDPLIIGKSSQKSKANKKAKRKQADKSRKQNRKKK